MKIFKPISLALLLAAAARSAIAAETFRTDINPALRYFLSFTATPDLPEADRNYLMTNEWRGKKLPDRFGGLVARYNPQFRLIRPAAQATVPCDWGIDWSSGPETMLPHLARIKTVARVARLRAMWDLQQGKATEARDNLLMSFTLARHCGTDHCLINALVQIAMENIVCSTIAENYFQLTPETLQQLEAGIEAAPARGTMVSCLDLEKYSSRNWAVARIRDLQKENPGNDAKILETVRGYFDSGDGQESQTLWPRVIAASGGTSDGVIKLLQDMDPFYSQLQVIMGLPEGEFEQQSRQFDLDVTNSSNPFVNWLIPSVTKAGAKERSMLAQLAMLHAGVEYKLHGMAGLQSVMDPYGTGPFSFQRFVFNGLDRGFELKSAFAGRGYPEVLIFVERDGPPFLVTGMNAGKTPSN